jgi:hypothetical protein
MLLREKADQVQPLLRATGLDCSLILVRETGLHPDPGFDLVIGADVVRRLELGVPTAAGLLGLEENVLVTEAGCTSLSSFAPELLLVARVSREALP